MHLGFIAYGKRSEVELLFRDMEAQKHKLIIKKDKDIKETDASVTQNITKPSATEKHQANMLHTYQEGDVDLADDESYIIDSGASVHVFKSLSAIEGMILLEIEEIGEHDTTVTLSGISGSVLTASHKGHLRGLGMFLIIPNAAQNLISVERLLQMGIYEVLFSHQGCKIKYTHTNDCLIWLKKPISNLYMATRTDLKRMSQLEEYSQEAFVLINEPLKDDDTESTVKEVAAEQQVETFTKEQVDRAKEVIKLHQSLDHPSNTSLINALNNGLIIGTRLTSMDVGRSERMFGKCIHCIAGKTVRPSYTTSNSEPADKIGSILHVDIYPFTVMTVGSNMFSLVSVDEFSCYVYAVMIKSKSLSCLITAVMI
jgi:hypothetical protein